MHISIIQPPLVQLNTPYPSGAYLSAFFRREALSAGSQINSVSWTDMSIRLFYRIFSAEGLSTLFLLTEKKAMQLAAVSDEGTAFNLRRYLSQKDLWVRRIDTIVSILRGEGRELCHEFVRSPHVPRGMRMERFLASLNRDVSVDDARLLASLAVEDIADYITAVFDKHFSLVHYAESLAASSRSFAEVEKTLRSPVLTTWFAPLISEFLGGLDSGAAKNGTGIAGPEFVFCISLPFPGTLASGLLLGKMIAERFGPRAVRVMGGGYINTEVRNPDDCTLFSYTDFLSYDRGYGSWKALLDCAFRPDGKNLYKTAYVFNGNIISPAAGPSSVHSETAISAEMYNRYAAYENTMTRTVIPDYADIDFSEYPRLADDINPMHRIWSDGAWIKAYLAHGCYWHKCAFCDVTLDYVCKYIPVDVSALHEGLSRQAAQKNVYGIHFADEAAPPRFLRDFALANSAERQTQRLSFWGNIRFEKSFTRDLADFLAYSGMTGVSGGIEIATGKGLASIDKGTDIKTLTAACAAFKEAGILVHAYMIYGYWEETPQDLINSAETLRQLFAAGLIDSAFWHKFVLTRHSRLYDEWKKGLHPALEPVVPAQTEKGVFAENDLRFRGEEKSAIYADGLTAALSAWMSGKDLEKPVGKWFEFPVPKPEMPRDIIDLYIEEYERNRDRSFAEPPAQDGIYIWLGGNPVVTVHDSKKKESKIQKKNSVFFSWIYMGEEFSLELDRIAAEKTAEAVVRMKKELASGELLKICNAGTAEHYKENCQIPEAELFYALRGRGLCRIR